MYTDFRDLCVVERVFSMDLQNKDSFILEQHTRCSPTNWGLERVGCMQNFCEVERPLLIDPSHKDFFFMIYVV